MTTLPALMLGQLDVILCVIPRNRFEASPRTPVPRIMAIPW